MRLLQCTSPVRDKWLVRWDVQADPETGTASYMEEEFAGRPDPEAVAALVRGWQNARTEEEIRSGFVWEGEQVWLSEENQFNYKAAHDLAVQTGGKTLPVTFKLGTDAKPVYRTFSTVDDLSAFYTAMVRHIQDALERGWRAKDAFSADSYT